LRKDKNMPKIIPPRYSSKDIAIRKIAKIYNTKFPDSPLSRRFKKETIDYFVGTLKEEYVFGVMQSVCTKRAKNALYAKKRFCHICWTKAEQPGVGFSPFHVISMKSIFTKHAKDLSFLWSDD
jgi:hypothetical protein